MSISTSESTLQKRTAERRETLKVWIHESNGMKWLCLIIQHAKKEKGQCLNTGGGNARVVEQRHKSGCKKTDRRPS